MINQPSRSTDKYVNTAATSNRTAKHSQVCTCDITGINIVTCKFIFCIQILSLERKRGANRGDSLGEGGGGGAVIVDHGLKTALQPHTVCMKDKLIEPHAQK